MNIYTLDDLRTVVQKNTVKRQLEGERLTRKKLLEGNCPEILKTTICDRTLTVYSDGYVLYEQNKRYTIFSVDNIKYEYTSVIDGKYTIPESEYCDDVVLALAMFGEIRLEKNSYTRGVMPQEEEIKYEDHNSYLSVPDFLDTMLMQYEKISTEKKLHMAINQLKPKQREVIMLYYFNNYTQDKTASILNIGRTSVESRLKNALNNLKKFMNK